MSSYFFTLEKNIRSYLFIHSCTLRRQVMKGMILMKLQKSIKDPELYSYLSANDERLWMYRHKFIDSSGKRKEKKKSGFTSEKAALMALLETKASTLRGESKIIEKDAITVGEWLDIWYEMNESKWKLTTRIQREAIIRLHLKPFLGHYKLQKLDRVIYRRVFLNALEGKYKENSIRLWHNIFKIAINAAVEEEILSRNRFTKITIATKEDSVPGQQKNFLTPSELITFLDEAKKHSDITFYCLFQLIAYTGIRRGESLGLQWKNINFKNKTITIERTRDEKSVRPPKTRNSYRTILIDDVVIKQLKNYNTWCKQALLKNQKKLDDNSFVFINCDTGDPISNSSCLYQFNKIKNKTNIPYFTIHGLRHTHATILLNQGQNVKEIAQRLGNTVDMIYKIYGHVLIELEQESVSLFSQSLAAVGAKSGANE